jgi:hypothetical protein
MKRVLTLCCLAASLSATAGGQTDSQTARARVQAAIQAMGGEERLRAIHTDKLEGIGHRYMLEQSERPEGPWVLDYFQITQKRDFDHGRLLEERRSRGCDSTECWKSAEWQVSESVVADGVAAIVQNGKMSPGPMAAVGDAKEILELGPEHALLAALEAGDLRNEADTILHGFLHHVVGFTWHARPVRIYLSGYTAFPTAVEVTRTRPYSVFWAPWGDVTTRTSFSFWLLEPGGLHYPRQWNFESNGQPDWTLTVNEVNFNVPLKEEAFAIPADERKAFAARTRTVEAFPLGSSNNPPQELAPGIVQVRGAFNVAEVKQDDGIVILEGPISNGYSAEVIADAKKRFGGLPIKAVITTSDAWPHIGGLREYVAREIPVYALDLNRPILERLFAAPHQLDPDALAKRPQAAKITYVAKAVELGKGENRMVIYPLREPTGERQMMIYFPARKLLYSSDLFQRLPSGEFFLPQTLCEAVDAVRREQLDVDTDFGMHLAPTAWKDIEAAVQNVVSASTR